MLNIFQRKNLRSNSRIQKGYRESKKKDFTIHKKIRRFSVMNLGWSDEILIQHKNGMERCMAEFCLNLIVLQLAAFGSEKIPQVGR